jgi:hypothetical protein
MLNSSSGHAGPQVGGKVKVTNHLQGRWFAKTPSEGALWLGTKVGIRGMRLHGIRPTEASLLSSKGENPV